MNNITLSQLASVSDLQRNYKLLLDRIKKFSEPVFLLRRNKPEAVLISVDDYENILAKNALYEEAMAEQAIENFKKAKKKGVLRTGYKASDLLNEN